MLEKTPRSGIPNHSIKWFSQLSGYHPIGQKCRTVGVTSIHHIATRNFKWMMGGCRIGVDVFVAIWNKYFNRILWYSKLFSFSFRITLPSFVTTSCARVHVASYHILFPTVKSCSALLIQPATDFKDQERKMN